MEKTLYILLALLCVSAIPASAQVVNKTYNYSHEATNDRLRQQIGLDYSMPDYETTTIDANIIGKRLAQMLESLKDNYARNEFNHLLSYIRDAQIEDRRAYTLRIDEMKIKRISKRDSVISISISTLSKPGKKQKYSNDVIISFINGLSANTSANELFYQLGRYQKK